MDIISHVWNTTPDSDTGITPFELEHGMRARSLADASIEIPPQNTKMCKEEDLVMITTSAKAFRKTLIQIKTFEKAKRTIALNKKGDTIKNYLVGNKIVFYLPPIVKQAKDLHKNPKHVLQ